MSRLRPFSTSADSLAHYRARSARRNAGTSIVMAALALLAALLFCAVLYAVALLLILLFNMIGEHAKVRMEMRLHPPSNASRLDAGLPTP